MKKLLLALALALFAIPSFAASKGSVVLVHIEEGEVLEEHVAIVLHDVSSTVKHIVYFNPNQGWTYQEDVTERVGTAEDKEWEELP